jgi:hypothetical protein
MLVLVIITWDWLYSAILKRNANSKASLNIAVGAVCPHYFALHPLSFFFFEFVETQARFVDPDKRVKSWLFQALIRGARPDSNSRPAVQISSYLRIYFLFFKIYFWYIHIETIKKIKTIILNKILLINLYWNHTRKQNSKSKSNRWRKPHFRRKYFRKHITFCRFLNDGRCTRTGYKLIVNLNLALHV